MDMPVPPNESDMLNESLPAELTPKHCLSQLVHNFALGSHPVTMLSTSITFYLHYQAEQNA